MRERMYVSPIEMFLMPLDQKIKSDVSKNVLSSSFCYKIQNSPLVVLILFSCFSVSKFWPS